MVFAIRGARLIADPGAAATLAGMAQEKRRAFAAGALAATTATLRGGSATTAIAASLAPSRRRVKANFARLHRKT